MPIPRVDALLSSANHPITRHFKKGLSLGSRFEQAQAKIKMNRLKSFCQNFAEDEFYTDEIIDAYISRDLMLLDNTYKTLDILAFLNHFPVLAQYTTHYGMQEAVKGARVPLIVAVAQLTRSQAKIEVLTELIECGANVNAYCDLLHQTPLFYAAKQGDSKIVKLLLERGADPEIVNKDNLTPKAFLSQNKENIDCCTFSEEVIEQLKKAELKKQGNVPNFVVIDINMDDCNCYYSDEDY